MNLNNKKIGNEGEEIACSYLLNKGYEILSRNWRTKEGEIDIICKHNSTIIFVEVKNLPNASKDMLCKVLNQEKRKRIIKTSKYFLLKHRQYNDSYIQFDVILIGMSDFESIYHIENAFSE